MAHRRGILTGSQVKVISPFFPFAVTGLLICYRPSERRTELEVRHGAFGVGEPVPRAGAEAEWDVEDAEIVDGLGAGGQERIGCVLR